MTDRDLATTLGDPEGALAPKIGEFLQGVLGQFGAVAVRATAGTHARNLSLLREGGAIAATAEADVDRAGRHRREALRVALAHGGSPRVVSTTCSAGPRTTPRNSTAYSRRPPGTTARGSGAARALSPRSPSASPERRRSSIASSA